MELIHSLLLRHPVMVHLNHLIDVHIHTHQFFSTFFPNNIIVSIKTHATPNVHYLMDSDEGRPIIPLPSLICIKETMEP